MVFSFIPEWYDLNQIPYDYIVKVTNRFKGLDLIDRVAKELWTEVRGIVQETGIKTIPMEKKCKKAFLGVSDGQGSLACCDTWGHKESDMTELN